MHAALFLESCAQVPSIVQAAQAALPVLVAVACRVREHAACIGNEFVQSDRTMLACSGSEHHRTLSSNLCALRTHTPLLWPVKVHVEPCDQHLQQ
jgi:hypothetical protein